MGIDLTLGIIDVHSNYAGDRLRLQRDYELFEVIKKIKPLPSEPILWHCDEGLKQINHDAYGDVLTYITPEQMKPFKDELLTVRSNWNTAVMQIVCSLERKRIILYWS